METHDALEAVIDARGLSCPGPVLAVMRYFANGENDSACVLVSNAAARDNVARLARNRGWRVSMEQEGDDWRLHLVNSAPRRA